MTRYNTLKVKLSNLHFNKLKSAMKNGTEVTWNLSSYDETSSPYKLLLTDTQDLKFSKTQLNDRMIQSRGTLPVDWIYTTSNVSSRKKSIRKGISLAPKLVLELAGKAPEYYINKGIYELNKKITSSKSSRTTLTKEDVMKEIKSSENRGSLLEGTTRRIICQGGGF